MVKTRQSLTPKLSSEGRWMDRGWGNNLIGRTQKVTNYIYRKKKLSPSKRTQTTESKKEEAEDKIHY